MNKLAIVAAAAFAIVTAASGALVEDVNDAERIARQPNKNTVGVPAATSVTAPAVGEHSVTGRCRVVWTGDLRGRRPVELFSNVIMHYRWTYLGKVISTSPYQDGWIHVYMVPDGDDAYRTSEAIEIPDQECDIEFYFFGTRIHEYYQYVDYTGLNIGVPGYSEEPSLAVTNHMSRSEVRMQSNGVEWFIRPRSGKSNAIGISIDM